MTFPRNAWVASYLREPVWRNRQLFAQVLPPGKATFRLAFAL